MNEILSRQNSPAISLPSFSCLATRYLLVIAKELCWMDKKLLKIHH
jgi:hypothetical protein